jgi:hypothetical protein
MSRVMILPLRSVSVFTVVSLTMATTAALAAVAQPAEITLWADDVPVATASGDQGLQLAVVSDGRGGAIVVWQDRARRLVFAQRIDAVGRKLWATSRQAAITDWEKLGASAVEDGAGGAIVAWYEGREGFCTYEFAGECDVYAQRFSAEGARLWGVTGVPVIKAPGNQGVSGIALASDGAGGMIAAWEDARPDCCKVYVQRLDGEGNPVWALEGIGVSPEPSIVFGPISAPPQVVPDGAGGAIVAWLDDQVNPVLESPPLTVQRIDAQGRILWAEGGVRVGTPVFVTFRLAPDGHGGALLAFTGVTGEDWGEMTAQRVSPEGEPLWGDEGVVIGSTQYYAEAPDVVADGSGGALVAWVEHRYDVPTAYGHSDIRAQHVNAGGAPLWGVEGAPVCSLLGNQDNPRVLGDGKGGGIIVWRDCRDFLDPFACFWLADIYAQHFTPEGVNLWPLDGTPVSVAAGAQGVAQGTPTKESFIRGASDGAGGAVVAWPDGRRGGCQNAVFTTECDVFAQRINSTPPTPSCGDPTGDGVTTASDALVALQAAVGLMACELDFCDVDGSGVVTASDALAMLNVAIGLPVEVYCLAANQTRR